MTRLMINEIPKTRTAFVEKWNSDHIFRARAKMMGFNVLFDGIVIFPSGRVAGKNVK